jgi:hypothetical protein
MASADLSARDRRSGPWVAPAGAAVGRAARWRTSNLVNAGKPGFPMNLLPDPAHRGRARHTPQPASPAGEAAPGDRDDRGERSYPTPLPGVARAGRGGRGVTRFSPRASFDGTAGRRRLVRPVGVDPIP